MVEVCEDSFSNAISLALQECERLVVICNTPSATWADVVRAWDAIESVWNDTLAFPVMLSDFGFASAAIDGVQPEVLRLKRFEMETLQSKFFIAPLDVVRNSAASWQQLSPLDRRRIQSIHERCEEAGVRLPADAQRELIDISLELNALELRCQAIVRRDIKREQILLSSAADIEGWPCFLKSSTAIENPETGPWAISPRSELIRPVLRHSRNEQTRKRAFEAIRAVCGSAESVETCVRMLQLRQRRAVLFGRESVAESVLAECQKEICDGVSRACQAVEPLRNIGKCCPPWDRALADMEVQASLGVPDETAVRNHLHHDQVLRGLFTLAGRLFGVRFEEDDKPEWATQKELSCYRVNDKNGLIGTLYYDPFTRIGKPRSAMCRPISLGKSGTLPSVIVSCLFLPSPAGEAQTLSATDTETLFHELGHALWFLLSGRNGAVFRGSGLEFASTFMESWLEDPAVIRGICGLTERDAVPAPIAALFKRSSPVRAAFALKHVAEFGLFDLLVHSDRETPSAERILKHFETATGQPNGPFWSFPHMFESSDLASVFFTLYRGGEELAQRAFDAFQTAKRAGKFEEAIEAFRDQVLFAIEPEKLVARVEEFIDQFGEA
ncbi:MAG: hypothetical protein CMJ47_08760 [Planctomyces sp.]|nr:hypothetical protein [Planctomyces sp.]